MHPTRVLPPPATSWHPLYVCITPFIDSILLHPFRFFGVSTKVREEVSQKCIGCDLLTYACHCLKTNWEMYYINFRWYPLLLSLASILVFLILYVYKLDHVYVHVEQLSNRARKDAYKANDNNLQIKEYKLICIKNTQPVWKQVRISAQNVP